MDFNQKFYGNPIFYYFHLDNEKSCSCAWPKIWANYPFECMLCTRLLPDLKNELDKTNKQDILQNMKQITKQEIGSKILEQTGKFSAYDITCALRGDGYFVEHADVKALIEDSLSNNQGLIKQVDTNPAYRYRVFELVKPDTNYIQQTVVAPVSRAQNTSGYSVFYKGKIFIAPNQKAAWGNKSNAVAQFGRWLLNNSYDSFSKKQRRAKYKQMRKVGDLIVVDKISIVASDI